MNRFNAADFRAHWLKALTLRLRYFSLPIGANVESRFSIDAFWNRLFWTDLLDFLCVCHRVLRRCDHWVSYDLTRWPWFRSRWLGFRFFGNTLYKELRVENKTRTIGLLMGRKESKGLKICPGNDWLRDKMSLLWDSKQIVLKEWR